MKTKYLEGKGRCFALFLLCFLTYALAYMSKNLFSSAMASIVEAGIMTKTQTGAISAAYWVAYAPFQVLGGFAADRYSPARLIAIGVGGSALASLVIYFNQSYPVMMGAWIFSAVIQFGVWPSVFKIVSTQIGPKYRDRSIFWILFSTSFGMGLSMLVAAMVTDWIHNFLFAFLIQTLSLIAFLPVYGRLERSMTVSEETVPVGGHEKEYAIPGVRLGRLFLASGLFVLLAINFLRGMTDNAVKMLTPTMLMESYADLPASTATALSILLVVFSAVGVLLGGVIQKRITSHEVKAMLLMYAVALPALALACLLGKLHYLWILTFLSVAVLFLHGSGSFAAPFVAKRFIPYGRSGTVSGLFNAVASLANVAASFLFAKMAEVLPWRAVLLSWVLSVAAAILLCLAVLRTWTRFLSLHKMR